jgi:hypothetical protein
MLSIPATRNLFLKKIHSSDHVHFCKAGVLQAGTENTIIFRRCTTSCRCGLDCSLGSITARQEPVSKPAFLLSTFFKKWCASLRFKH